MKITLGLHPLDGGKFRMIFSPRRYYFELCKTQTIDWLKKRSVESAGNMTQLDMATIKLALLKKLTDKAQ